MKTPKRDYPVYYEHGINPNNGDIIMDPLAPVLYDARWKRKNRTAQYKRTIERLLKKNNDMAAVLKTVQRAIEVILAEDTTSVEMSLNWENTIGRKEATRKARLIRRAHRRACRAINAESGQQTDLPPTGGKRASDAQNAENAKQATLLCTDAEQLETRKGN